MASTQNMINLELTADAAEAVFLLIGTTIDQSNSQVLDSIYERMGSMGITGRGFEVVVRPNAEFDPSSNIDLASEGLDQTSPHWSDEYHLVLQELH